MEARKNSTGTPDDSQNARHRAYLATLDSAGLEVVPAGLEVGNSVEGKIPYNNDGKQVSHPETDTAYVKDLHTGAAGSSIHQPKERSSSPHETKRQRVCGRRSWMFWAALGSLVVILGIALGSGLGVGLYNGDYGASGTDDAGESTTRPRSRLLRLACSRSEVPSTQCIIPPIEGGMAQVFLIPGKPSHKQSAISPPTTKALCSITNITAVISMTVSAKNSSPISAVRDDITQPGTDIWDVFYLDKDHIVHQRTANSTSQEWSEGSINDLRLSAFDGDLVGLHACWIGKDPQASLRLWYASENATFRKYVRKSGKWTHEKTWQGYSGSAGVGCYSIGAGDSTYVVLINLSNELEIWYRDVTDQLSEWEQSNVIIRDVLPASSISLSTFICVLQMRGGDRLWVVAMHWEGNPTSLGGSGTFTQNHMIGGKHFTALADGDVQLVYSQTAGNDIEGGQRAISERNTAWISKDIALGFFDA